MMKLVKPFNLPLPYRMYLWLGIATLAVLVITFTIILPSLSRLETSTTNILKTLSDNSLSDAAATNIIHAKQDEKKLQTDLIELQRAFIQEQNPLEYLTQLETLAAERSVTLDFDVKETSDSTIPAGQVKPISTTVDVTGSWSNVTAFINDLMTQPIYFITETIELSAQGDQVNNITATLAGNTYWQ